ncbi:hypothetical protein F1643_09905 [Azospirillum sp. INR13]|uniref:hypothetical protein n=1 Tax=Azospirillum sp. INR13 TaxID=2596919 RepID=UPI001891F7EA|nr:hypothetical protein [Azospirillum sp. INR13]MBF5094746.1 hypothetical protein [Azospirillum sp. INR13]
MSTDMITAKMLDTAESLTPDDIVTYLKGNGWVDAGPYGSLARLYRLQVNEQVYEAVIPNTQDAGDFKWRMVDLFHSLAKAKNKQPKEFCEELDDYRRKKYSEQQAALNDSAKIESSRPFRGMNSDRADLALAIKACLDSLGSDAARSDLYDLAKFIELAALAAEEAALSTSGGASQFNELRDFLNQSSNFRKH